MKHRSFHGKKICKNGQKNKQQNYISSKMAKRSINTGFWGGFISKHCVKESSHGNAMVPQNKGEPE